MAVRKMAPRRAKRVAARAAEAKARPERVYMIPATSFHFGRPEESYLYYDNHRKMLSELFANSKKYYCAEDIKQDLMSLAAPISPCSTYDETARVAWAVLQRCDTLEEFQRFLEGWLNHPDGQIAGGLVVPAMPKSEVGRDLLQPATELTRGCFAICAIAVAALVCLLASCVTGKSVLVMDPEKFRLPDYARKVVNADAFRAYELKVRG